MLAQATRVVLINWWWWLVHSAAEHSILEFLTPHKKEVKGQNPNYALKWYIPLAHGAYGVCSDFLFV